MATFTNCNTGVSNTGRITMGGLWAGLTAAMAAYNTGQAIHFATKQYDIAKQYLTISQWWNAYKANFFDPVEDEELNEAMNLTEETPYYDIARGRAQTAGRIRFKNAVNKAVQCTSEYCTGLRQQLLRDTLAQEATSIAALTGLGYRSERAYIEAQSDRRWKRMVATAQRGRGMQAPAVSYAQLAYGIYGNLGAQAGQGAQGAAALAGYMWNRNETIYPTLLRSTGANQDPPEQKSITPERSSQTSMYNANGDPL